jgi:hypothetical protein
LHLKGGFTVNGQKGLLKKTGVLMAGAVLALLAFGPDAGASPVRINFSGMYDFGSDTGTPFSGYADLTIQADPAASATFPTPPGAIPPGPRVDPEGAQSIVDATGSFNGHAITGVLPLNGASPSPGEYLPASFSALIAADTPDGAPAVTFDNLFYASGSPVTCIGINQDGTTTALYPFSGGFLDIYGVLFTLDNGQLLDLWSNGVMPGAGLNYGAILFAPAQQDYQVVSAQFNGVMAAVPEPGWLWLFGAGLVGLFAWRRSLEKKRVPVTR